MRRRGFTLLELVAVITILMIIAGISIPKYTGIVDENRLKADGVTAVEIGKIAERYYMEDKTSAMNSTKLQAHIVKTYGGVTPVSQFDKEGSFVTTISEGRATVVLQSSEGNITLVNKGQFVQPEVKGSGL